MQIESSLVAPLKFFELFVSNKKIENQYQNYLIDISPESIDYQYQIGVLQYYRFNNNLWVESDEDVFTMIFRDSILRKLEIEVNKSKGLILEFYSTSIIASNGNVESYLKSIESTINSILNDNLSTFVEFPYLISPFETIVEFVNKKFIIEDSPSKHIEIDETALLKMRRNTPTRFNNIEEKIIEIIGYMQGYNEKGQLILSKEDYQLLIDYTKDLVLNDCIPTNPKRLSPKITGDLLRFSYYVLHKEIFTTKKIRETFISFMKSIFPAFDNTENKTLKQSFSKKNGIPPDEFLSSIILKHL